MNVRELAIDERLDPDGDSVVTRLGVGARDVVLVEGSQVRSLPSRAVTMTMRRYGRELEPGVDANGDWLELGDGRLQHLSFRAAVDADVRDYLVWTEPGRPPVAALGCHIAAALRHLARSAADE